MATLEGQRKLEDSLAQETQQQQELQESSLVAQLQEQVVQDLPEDTSFTGQLQFLIERDFKQPQSTRVARMDLNQERGLFERADIAFSRYVTTPNLPGTGVGGFAENILKGALRFPPEMLSALVQEGPAKFAKELAKFPIEVATQIVNALGADVPPVTEMFPLGEKAPQDIVAPTGKETREQIFKDPTGILLAAFPFLKGGVRAGVRKLKPKVTPKPVTEVIKPIEKPPAIEKLEAPIKTVEPPKTGEKVIGLNKVEIERIRKDTGLDKLPEAERKTWQRTLNEAKNDKLNESALTTAEEVIQSKRPISDVEHAGMTLKAVELKNEYTKIISEVSESVQKGDVNSAQNARQRADVILGQIERLTQASDLGGRESARALSIRRSMIDIKTYDLASVVQRARASKGSKLTPKENARFEEVVAKHAKAEKELKDLEIKYQNELSKNEELMAQQTIRAVSKRKKFEKKKAVAKEKILTERANIKKQLEAIGFRVNDVTGVTAEGSYLIGKLAVNYIKEGAITLKDVVNKVRNDIPQLSERDVYRALIEKNPRQQAKAKVGATKRIGVLRKQAKLLLDIEKAEKGIFPKKGKPQPQPKEIKDLQNTLKDLKSQAYKSGLDTKRLEKSLQTIEELKDQLANNFRSLKKKQPMTTPELDNLKKKIDVLRKTMRVEDEIAGLNQQLRTGDFKVPTKPQIKKVPVDLERKQVELNLLRKRVRGMIEDVAPLTGRRGFTEGVNLLRTLKASLDMSYALRQGLVLSATRPLLAGKSFGKAFQATFSKVKAEQIDHAMRTHPHHYLRERAGLYLPEVGIGKPTLREEIFMSRLAEKIPVLGRFIKASERNMVTGLNQLRAGAFDQFLQAFPNATSAELKAWANWVNIASGRGNLGRAAAISNELSLGVFAPRFAVSRVQTPFVVLQNLKNPRVRNAIAKDMAGLGALGMTTLALAKLAGLDVGVDPRSADFGKIKIGGTRIDIWAGIQQPMRLLTRIGLAASDKAGITGKDLTDWEKDFDPLEAIGRFSSYKVAPAISVPLELFKGETIVGEEREPSETAWRAITPLVYEDIYDAYLEGGFLRAGVSTGLGFFGVGVSTYQTRKDLYEAMAIAGFGTSQYKKIKAEYVKRGFRFSINEFNKFKKRHESK